jgi:hypothetical protein
MEGYQREYKTLVKQSCKYRHQYTQFNINIHTQTKQHSHCQVAFENGWQFLVGMQVLRMDFINFIRWHLNTMYMYFHSYDNYFLI